VTFSALQWVLSASLFSGDCAGLKIRRFACRKIVFFRVGMRTSSLSFTIAASSAR
jgi:hypothetical protein